MNLDDKSIPNLAKTKEPKLLLAYKGLRLSYTCYHPAHHGPPAKEGQWETTKARFLKTLNEFCEVCELYTDQQVLSEKVAGQAWKKDILKMVSAMERQKNVYELEALATYIFDVDDKLTQRDVDYHAQVKQLAQSLEALDNGRDPRIQNGVGKKSILYKGWAG